MEVYRGNYRSALMGALEETYARTRRYAGEAPFRQVAIHHALSHPPSGWTIDAAGAGFDATCAQLFASNPEVAELAWLEWTLLELATAPDSAPIGPEDFAQASVTFGDSEWAELRLTFQPRAAVRIVQHDLAALWRALGEENCARPDPRLPAPKACLVWREGERPTFILVEADHAPAFAAMQAGASYGEVIGVLLGEEEPTPEAVQRTATRAGAMLGRWLNEGIIIGLKA
jgi:hypothetical protein